MSHEQGHSVKPATKAIYTPLIDMKSSDPDTTMTAMMESPQMNVGKHAPYARYIVHLQRSTILSCIPYSKLYQPHVSLMCFIFSDTGYTT